MSDSVQIVYFSSLSGNTKRFVEKLDFPLTRIPLSPKEAAPPQTAPYVLVCPSYSGDHGQDAVPKQVIRFLNIEENRRNLIGVIAGGNTNFGEYYGHAGRVIAEKCNVPLLYRFELMGTPSDVLKVQKGLKDLWTQQCKKKMMA